MGWSFYFLKEISENLFLILVPNFNEDPFKNKTDDLTLSMTILFQQVSLIKRIGREDQGVLCTCLDTLIVNKNIFETDNFYMERQKPTETKDSGWYIGTIEGETKEEDLILMYTFQVLQKNLKPLGVCFFLSNIYVFIRIKS